MLRLFDYPFLYRIARDPPLYEEARSSVRRHSNRCISVGRNTRLTALPEPPPIRLPPQRLPACPCLKPSAGIGTDSRAEAEELFTLLGVTIGVMFLIAVVSIVEGMSKYVEEDFIGRFIGANTFTLRGGRLRRPGYRGGVARQCSVAAAVQARRPLCRGVLPKEVRWQSRPTRARWRRRPRATSEAGDHLCRRGRLLQIKNYEIVAGRAIAQQESVWHERGRDRDEVATFFSRISTPSAALRIRGVPYTVIGRIEKQGSIFGMSMDRLIIGPLESGLGRITNPRGDIDGMMLQASSTMAMFDGMELVREAMRARRHLRPAQRNNFSIETSESALEDFNEVKTVMTIAGTALPMIGLVVGGLVIMNIMLVAVAERTREIGIRKSLGARRKDILRQFLVEAATLSTLGAVVGIGLGLGAAWLISATTPLPAAVAPWSLLVATLLGLVVGIVSGVYPARRASRLDPIDALRQE